MTPLDLALFLALNAVLWARCIRYHIDSEAMFSQALEGK